MLERKDIKWLPLNMERAMQYTTMGNAQVMARRCDTATKRKHKVAKTVTWRELTPYLCWTIKLEK